MAFDKTWEKIFKNQNWGKYPSEDIIRFIASKFNSVSNRAEVKVLDIGCGGGAHSWFLAREGFDTFGIDGSESGIKQAKALLDQDRLVADLVVGDFTSLDYPEAYFDAIIDSSAIQHNPKQNIQDIHRQIMTLLKPGGSFCGVMINTLTSGWNDAEKLEENTYKNFKSGPIQKDLLVHFFTETEVLELMSGYEEVTLERMIRTVNNGKDQYGHFVITGRKPLFATEK
jgi:2-polyprenyl-3-methyl-5-hydroxy-6-metoxy-1,4-benzoquinol methylase